MGATKLCAISLGEAEDFFFNVAAVITLQRNRQALETEIIASSKDTVLAADMRALCNGFIEMSDRKRMEYLLKRKLELDLSRTGPGDRKGKRKAQDVHVVEKSVNKSPARKTVGEGIAVDQGQVLLRPNQGTT